MNTTDIDTAGSAATGAVVLVIMLVELVFAIAIIAGMWKIFAKAGQPGWAAIIPIYNLIVLLQVAGKPLWWIVLFIIPIANLIVIILTYIAVAEKFGKGAGFGVGMFFLPFIFMPMLGFGDAQYEGAAASPPPLA